jgi:RNA polymerase sigma-70 factor (ECF subfamily)
VPIVQNSDADLIDTDFGALFDRHAVAVHGYLARRIGVTAADDLLAQTFLVAFERRSNYDRARPDARPWLYGIATNLLRRHHREEVRQYRAWARTGVDPVDDGHADRVADRVDAGAWSSHLATALARLKAPDRDVLLLFAWESLSYDEIAQALNIPVGTVRSRLHRARAAVRAALPDVKENDHG